MIYDRGRRIIVREGLQSNQQKKKKREAATESDFSGKLSKAVSKGSKKDMMKGWKCAHCESLRVGEIRNCLFCLMLAGLMQGCRVPLFVCSWTCTCFHVRACDLLWKASTVSLTLWCCVFYCFIKNLTDMLWLV